MSDAPKEPGGVFHGGGLAAAAARHGGEPADWLDLSTGINPVPPAIGAPPPAVWARLPDRDLHDAACRAAQACYGTPVLPLPVPGTQAAIQQLPGLAPAGVRVAIVSPTYGEYASVFSRAGFAVDAVSGVDVLDAAHTVVVVVNPNNPDGRVTPRRALLDLAETLTARGGLLIVDEAFADCDPGESLAGDAGRSESLIVLRSFGKFFGFAGLRLGFVLAVPAVSKRLANALGPWAVSGPALSMAVQAMGDAGVLEEIRRSIAERGAVMARILDDFGLSIHGRSGLFFLVHDERAAAIRRTLCARHILVRAFETHPHWLRFGLTPDAASDERLRRALADCLDSLSPEQARREAGRA